MVVAKKLLKWKCQNVNHFHKDQIAEIYSLKVNSMSHDLLYAYGCTTSSRINHHSLNQSRVQRVCNRTGESNVKAFNDNLMRTLLKTLFSWNFEDILDAPLLNVCDVKH